MFEKSSTVHAIRLPLKGASRSLTTKTRGEENSKEILHYATFAAGEAFLSIHRLVMSSVMSEVSSK